MTLSIPTWISWLSPVSVVTLNFEGTGAITWTENGSWKKNRGDEEIKETHFLRADCLLEVVKAKVVGK